MPRKSRKKCLIQIVGKCLPKTQAPKLSTSEQHSIRDARTSVQWDIYILRRQKGFHIFIHTYNKRAADMRFCTFFYFFSFLLCILQTKGPLLSFVKMRPISAGMPGHLSLTIFFSFPYPIFLALFSSLSITEWWILCEWCKAQKTTHSILSLPRTLARSIFLGFFYLLFCRWYFQFFSFFLVVGCFPLQFKTPAAAYSDEPGEQRRPPQPCSSGTRDAPTCAAARSCRSREACP